MGCTRSPMFSLVPQGRAAMGMRYSPAPRLWALAAFVAATAIGTLQDPARADAAPLWQQETVYRPECPANETSGGLTACRVTAGVSGPRDGASNDRRD